MCVTTSAQLTHLMVETTKAELNVDDRRFLKLITSSIPVKLKAFICRRKLTRVDKSRSALSYGTTLLNMALHRIKDGL